MLKTILAILLCCSQLAVSALTWRTGATGTWLLLFIVQNCAIAVNYCIAQKLWQLVILDVVLLAVTPFAHDLMTYLYTENISNDGMSYVIGQLGAWAGMFWALLLSLISVGVWIYNHRKGRKEKQLSA